MQTGLFNPLDATHYKSFVVRANYFVADRFGIQYVCKEFSCAMARPRIHDWEKLRRLGNYFRGKPRFIHRCWRIQNFHEAVVHTDANWAGDRRHRKSTFGGCIDKSGHWIKAWSKTQNLVVPSPAESELCAVVRVSAEGIGIRFIVKDEHTSWSHRNGRRVGGIGYYTETKNRQDKAFRYE